MILSHLLRSSSHHGVRPFYKRIVNYGCIPNRHLTTQEEPFHEVTDETFKTEVLDVDNKVVIVDFYAE